jgi:hypothetical protein
MKLSIFGFLIGTGLFGGGFVHHDTNYEVQTLHSAPDTWSHQYDLSTKENKAYVIGTVGAAIMTLSVQHLLAQRKAEEPGQDKAIGKFRTALQMLAGAGLWEAGLWFHELGGRDDRIEVRFYEGREFREKGRDDIREHLGYFVGTLGTVYFTSAAKDMWSMARRDKTKGDLDKAFKQLRMRLAE